MTADHPEVKGIVDAAVKSAEESELTLPPETYIDVMEEAIKKLEKEKRSTNPNGPL